MFSNHQVTIVNATGVLAKPFTAGSAAASGKSELFKQLLDLCLHSKQSHFSAPLIDIITATEKCAPEVAVGMLTAVADLVLQTADPADIGTSRQTAHQQRHKAKASNTAKEAATADLTQKQEWALLVLVTFAKRGLAHCQTVLGLYFCQVNAFLQRRVLCLAVYNNTSISLGRYGALATLTAWYYFHVYAWSAGNLAVTLHTGHHTLALCPCTCLVCRQPACYASHRAQVML